MSTFLAARLSAHAQGNLVVNGNFEDAGGSFNGWTVATVPINSTLLGSNTNAPDGVHFALFNHSPGSFSQTLPTTAGTFYTLNLSAVEFDGTNTATVAVNGSLLATLNFTTSLPVSLDGFGPFNYTWENFSYGFTAAAGSTTIAFNYSPQVVALPDPFAGTDLYYGAGGIDAISVIPQAVPEPTTVAFLGVGLAVACRWRKRL